MTAVTAENIEHQLPQAVRDLEAAISALIDPRPVEGGWLEPRYHELREALDTARNTGTHTRPSPQAPLWIAGLDVLIAIDTFALQHEPGWPIGDCGDYPTAQRLNQLRHRRWTPPQTPLIRTLTNEILKLVADTDQLFSPAPVYLRGDKCPRCGHTHTLRDVGDEKPHRIPALQIHPENGAHCNNCRARWTPDRLPFLGRLLGHRIQGVIS